MFIIKDYICLFHSKTSNSWFCFQYQGCFKQGCFAKGYFKQGFFNRSILSGGIFNWGVNLVGLEHSPKCISVQFHLFGLTEKESDSSEKYKKVSFPFRLFTWLSIHSAEQGATATLLQPQVNPPLLWSLHGLESCPFLPFSRSDKAANRYVRSFEKKPFRPRSLYFL